MDHDRDLGAEGGMDKTKGNLNQGLGKAEEKLGDATDNEDMEGRGLERQGKGKVQEGLGRAKEAIDDLTDH